MSISVARAKRASAVRELRAKYECSVREYNRPAIGMGGFPNDHVAERQKNLMAQMTELEKAIAEMESLEGEALIQAFNPPPPEMPAGTEGLAFVDTLNRGTPAARQVVRSVNGQKVAR
jgi:hypothetical protein